MRKLLVVLSLGFPVIAGAEVTERLGYTYYDAIASHNQSLVGILDAASPHRSGGEIFHGMTNWTVNWKFEGVENPGGMCRITRVDTELAVDIDLPRLVGADSRQAEAFDKYLSALRAHELGHYSIAKEAAAAVDDDIRALPESPDCKTLFAAANRAGDQALEKYKQEEVQYDAVTNHGKTQGAWLDD